MINNNNIIKFIFVIVDRKATFVVATLCLNCLYYLNSSNFSSSNLV